jgi:RNA polymerase sigma factor (sigma-70 family)
MSEQTIWSVEHKFEEIHTRVRKTAWQIARSPQDYEDVVQDMMLTLVEAQAKEPGFVEQTPAYQVRRAYWLAMNKRRDGYDREARHLQLDQPVTNGQEESMVTFADFVLVQTETPADEAERSITREKVREALVALAGTGESGRKQAEILYRRFWLNQTVAEASTAMGISKGNGCYFSSAGMKALAQAQVLKSLAAA